MIFLPVKCEGCGEVSLVAERDCAHGESACTSCAGNVLVLPGCAYAEGDVPLFAELKSSVDGAALSPSVAAQLSLLLDDFGVARDPAQAFSLMFEHEPSLASLQQTLDAHPQRLRQALSMLSMLLSDQAMSRASGVALRPGVTAAMSAGS